MRKVALAALALVVLSLVPATAWSNGGYSADANNPDYGTHDWLAQHALDWVPDNMDFWIRNNLAIYLYGTELPDNSKAVLGDGIGDTTLHHVYYRSNGQLQDDASARRAREACDQVLSCLNAKDYAKAAKWVGVASHYVCDLAVFGHVMGSSTDWGSEKHHSDYEDWVTDRTNRYDTPFTAYLSFDGKLETILAYDAALILAQDTTFDGTGKGRTAKWMDDNYNPGSSSYQGRIGESLNLAVNLLADVIYSISQTGQLTSTTSTSMTSSGTTSPLATTTIVTTSSSLSTTTVTVTTSYTSTSSSILITTSTTTMRTTSSTSTSVERTTTTMLTTPTSTTQASSTATHISSATPSTSQSQPISITTTSPLTTTTASSPSTATSTTTSSYIPTSPTALTTTTTSTAQTSSSPTTSYLTTLSISTTQSEPRRCIIATAAYGSELEPDVQAGRPYQADEILHQLVAAIDICLHCT